jgi:toxin ParE1/3/4
MNYWLHPEAREDLREAAEFYRDNAGIALSQSLLAEFERSVKLLLAHPRLGGEWRRNKRRFVMKQFPFAVIYTVSGDQLRVLAVAHHSRRPGYWRGRR